MEAQFTQVNDIRRTMIDEIFNAMGLPRRGWLRPALWPFAWAPADRFARLVHNFEVTCAEIGFTEAARELLEHFIRQVNVNGAEYIPPDGPLLIASNHPGAMDALAIAASLPREDLKIVVSSVPFFHTLAYIRDHLICTAQDAHGRMLTLRNAIRHLRDGGSVLIFPSGTVDPDPCLLPGAAQALETWSSSLALMLDKAPSTQLLITTVSGVLAPECWKHPLVRLRHNRWEKQKLAEYIQVIQQLVLGKRHPIVPHVVFAKPLTLPELRLEERLEDSMQAIVAHARRLMETQQVSVTSSYSRCSSTGGAAGP